MPLEQLGERRWRPSICRACRLPAPAWSPAAGSRVLRPPTLPTSLRGLHQAVVHPVLGQRLAVAAFALGDFVFVMREDQVEPAAVDVERLAQHAAAHGRALDVPARAGLCPRGCPTTARPAWRSSTGRSRPASRLRSAISPPSPCMLATSRLLSLPYSRVAGHVEIHVAVGRVGKALVDQRLRELDDLVDVVGRLGKVVDRVDAQRLRGCACSRPSSPRPARPSACLRLFDSLISLSSTSVMLTTSVTL